MTEHLDDLLAVHHFLNVAVFFSEVLLLLYEEASGFSRQLSGDEHGHQYHEHTDDGQRPGQCDHGNKGDDKRHHGIDGLRNALADQLPERIDVIRIDGHDVAVRILVKIPDWQRFHVREQLLSKITERSLRDRNHDSLIGIGSCDTNQINNRQLPERCRKRGKITAFCCQHRQNISVDQSLLEQRSLKRCPGCDQNADNDQQKRNQIVLQNQLHQPYK